jgi:hypothetical protein
MNRQEMIDKLSEIDLDAFYSQSMKNQERELRLIFASFYKDLPDHELAEIVAEFEADCEED